MEKRFALVLCLSFAVQGHFAFAQGVGSLVINEFMASNDLTIVDGDGDYSDWLEVYNPTTESVSLVGCYLTDDKEELTKWVFPDRTESAVSANGYLVVFASDQDETDYVDSLGYIHTTFKLSATTEDIALVDTDGQTVISSYYDYLEQGTDVSYGVGSNSITGFMQVPTPGAANGEASPNGWVSDTKFSVKRGFYTNPFSVEITTATDGATIVYTLDASTPSETNGTVYSVPLTVSETTTLRAMAYRTDWVSTNADTQTYLFIDDIITQPESQPTSEWPAASKSTKRPPGPGSGTQEMDYGMDPDVTGDPRYSGLMDDALLAIPSISIVTDLPNLFDSSDGIYANSEDDLECPASVEYILPDGTEGFQVNTGLRIRGGSSARSTNPKHSFRIIMRSEYGDSKLKYPLFGENGPDKFDKLDFRTAQNFSWNNTSPDYATWLDDPFSRDTMRDMSQPYTRGDFFHLYLDGVYWGLYQTEERPESYYAQTHLGGDEEDYDALKADSSNGVIYATDGTTDLYNSFWSLVNAGVSSNTNYLKLQGKNVDGSDNSAYPRYLDPENLIDYMLIVFFTGARDMPLGPPQSNNMPRNLNVVANHSDLDGFKYIVHDNEWSLLHQYGVNANRVSMTLTSALGNQNFFNPWWLHLELKSNAEYKLDFADRIHKHFFNDGALTPDVCTARYQGRIDEIDLPIIAESARWGDSLSSNSPRTRDDDWLPEVNWVMNSFFNASPQTRTEVVLAQLKSAGLYPSVDAPEYSQHGGEVTSGFNLEITTSTGTIYYTTDGNDPRLIGGSVATSAQSGSSGLTVPVTSSPTVKSRAMSGSTWSALTEADFTTESGLSSIWLLF